MMKAKGIASLKKQNFLNDTLLKRRDSVPRVGQEYQTKHGTLIISSFKTSEHEIETYGAKNRMYYVHAKGNGYWFLGRFFSLREARKFVLNH